MGKVLIVNIDKCNGCYNCQLSCKDEHVGNDWTPIAAPQPDTGHFWYKITEHIQGSIPKVRVRYMHEMCQHCLNPPCVSACKTSAIYKRGDGAVIIDPSKCEGARDCAKACPYNAIYFNDILKISQKCTRCAHLLDDGWEEPRCVHSCPTDALTFGEEADLQELISQAEQLNPEANTNPSVYYIGLLNKFFIAGDIYDPITDECIKGATVTLINKNEETVSVQTTDTFGDFWFEKQKPGEYKITIEADGYTSKEINNITAVKDINIGSIEMTK